VKLEFSPVHLSSFLPTDHSHREIVWLGFYELPLSRKIAALARDGGLLVDAGANIGYFTLIWAGLNPANRAMCFEPSPSVATMLKGNIDNASLSSRVKVSSVALGKEVGTMPFDVGPENESSWGGLSNGAKPGSISVKVDRLDNLISPDKTIDVLKIDAEGADSWILNGCERLLREGRVRHIFFERNRGRMTQLGIEWDEPVRFLEGCGYKAKHLAGNPGLELLHAEPGPLAPL
jgi:FkbM family methyltransferase